MRSDIARVRDIIKSIDRIQRFVSPEDANLGEDSPLQDLVLLQLIIIGEASNGVSEELQERFPDVPWSDIIGVRNIIIHQYWNTDMEIIWRIFKKRLPVLRNKMVEIESLIMTE